MSKVVLKQKLLKTYFKAGQRQGKGRGRQISRSLLYRASSRQSMLHREILSYKNQNLKIKQEQNKTKVKKTKTE